LRENTLVTDDLDGTSPIAVAGALDGARRLGGLFDGFEAYKTATEEDYRALLTGGLVVPDTNVFLNLYRYNAETRDDLFSVLHNLADRLWVPHQVMVEFWRNREAVLRDPRDTDRTIQELGDQQDKAVRTFRTWANRVGLQEERSAELSGVLTAAFETVSDGVGELADDAAAEFSRNTNKDPVLARLEPILDGRVGLAMGDVEHVEAIVEAKRRASTRQPPGYKDIGKEGDDSAGDYLVWTQVLSEALSRCRNVLLVTGDVKEDWWRRHHGELRGPRHELVDEMRKVAGVRLFIIRPESLLLQARQALQVTVRDQSVQDVERVDRFLAEDEFGGWNIDALTELLSRLELEGWRAQAAAIRQAAEAGGFVSREIVYAIGKYDPDRSLRGFTRPVNRITRGFREREVIPESAVDVLSTEYDAASVNG
jgi:hypothetical protein